MSAAALFDAAWREGLRPSPPLTVSQWADAHRVLPQTSAEPGRWSTDRTPYLREIMDALSVDSPIERVVFMKGAQIGGTEVGLNFVGYVIDHAPGLALLVMPSLDMVKRNTRTRLDPLIDATPALRDKVVPARSRDPGNTATHKRFTGGELVMTGANAASALRSTPARFLFLDEVDAFPLDVEGEGDPVALAVQRTVTFGGRRRVLMVSTPTIRDLSRIEAAYRESDQRRYLVPCKHCGERFEITWERIVWTPGAAHKPACACPSCGGLHDERDKPAMLRSGAWEATGTGDGKTAGFHLSSLYSPFEPWAAIVADFLDARGDPARLKAWTNTKLAQTWDEGATRIEPNALAARAESWGEGLPDGAAILTAGVDVQGDRLEVEIVAWGAGEESWSIDYVTLYGPPGEPGLWLQLDEVLARRYAHPRATPDMGVRATCIDSGGHFTGKVYEFAAARASRRVWAIKGRAGQGVPVWPPKASYTAKGKGAPVWIIGVDGLKELLAARLSRTDAGPGACHFPLGRDAAWFAGLTSEAPVTRYNRGRPLREWRTKPGVRNEPLDCRIYSMAALEGLKRQGLRLDVEAARIADLPWRGVSAVLTPPARPTVIKSRWMGRAV